jgi:hypothetical protein
MSVTFSSDAPFKAWLKPEPCLCAQMGWGFPAMMRGEDSAEVRANLQEECRPDCLHCKGTGIEVVEETDAPSLNLANDNAARLLAILGLPCDEDGEVTIAESRRALMRARARQDLSLFTREGKTVYGAPRAQEDGSVELRPVRAQSFGLSAEGLRDRIERFGTFVEEAAARGARTIFWG